jgi:hypothetical protein
VLQNGRFDLGAGYSLEGVLNGARKASWADLLPEAEEAQSRRDGPIVAWHEVPGTAPPQKDRHVGHGMIGRRPNPRGI